jgi:non-ribosomal peptide synthetase component F
MNLLAVFYIMFYKYSSQDDIVVGSSIAGRRHANLHPLIGMFVNELALRNQPHGEKTYIEFLNQVKKSCLQAYENQDYQFEELVNRLDPERNPSRNPIFDVALVLQNFEQEQIKLEGLTIIPGHMENKTSKFDLTFFASEDENRGEINFVVEYYTEIFNPETIRQYSRHFINIIKQVNRNPGVKIADIAILSDEEKRLVLDKYNNTYSDYPRTKTLHSLFEEQVERTPNRIALLDEDKGTLQVTYNELNKKSNQLADYLRVAKNTQPDDIIGILMENFPVMITAILGILKSGGGYVPIDPLLPEKRMKSMIDDSGLSTIISQKQYIKQLNRLQWDCEGLGTFLCLDSTDIYTEQEIEKNQLMEEKLWEYIGEQAVDEITGGGWISSYTHKPFTKKEMDEYAHNILVKLKPLLNKKMKVLEIGCASGISMFEIAPHVAHYYGTDLSRIIIEKDKKRIAREKIENITLVCLPAHEIDQLEESNFDLVILNSVIQSFHGHNYLRQVINKIIPLAAPQCWLFFGDIMDQDL